MYTNHVTCSDPHDTANYLKLVQTLREILPKKTLITAAVGTTPFNDENQQPSTHLDKNWAKAIDGIYIMVTYHPCLLCGTYAMQSIATIILHYLL